jgi:hypothetical protein
LVGHILNPRMPKSITVGVVNRHAKSLRSGGES